MHSSSLALFEDADYADTVVTRKSQTKNKAPVGMEGIVVKHQVKHQQLTIQLVQINEYQKMLIITKNNDN